MSNKPSSVREYPLKITNVVCTCNLGVANLDLAAIAVATHGRVGVPGVNTQQQQMKQQSSSKSTNQPDVQRISMGIGSLDQQFPSCVSRCYETGTTNSVFRSGVVVIGGAQTEEVALLSAYLFAQRLYDTLNYHTNVYNFRVQNIVSTFGLGYELNARLFEQDHQLHGVWDRDAFRGLSYKFVEHKVNLVIFETGNIVVTGGKSVEQLKNAADAARIELAKYRLGHEYRVPTTTTTTSTTTTVPPMPLATTTSQPPSRKRRRDHQNKKHPMLKSRRNRMISAWRKKAEILFLTQLRARNVKARLDTNTIELLVAPHTTVRLVESFNNNNNATESSQPNLPINHTGRPSTNSKRI
jgi:TATA-box binding protein (TBP) (component of TFIID and TFIIIB)